ncbi:MAG TPA: 6-carboxytetrahydropterin synthase [Bacteroidia bacterium]|nr:6-carboxytetrahydropterin synthase [Bacteroidia bacterium]HRS59761.1 6-carboxytetrahydropterin synthase [Bacteroidia bacterium]HRU69238.1 6-carboxytetrahydropterin synthase [Bacteroidia bacterium]
MIYITRKENFNAAHRVFLPELSDEENYDRFGACSNPNWHGHNYTLFVTIKGKPDKDSGYLFDLKKLSRLIKELVIEKVDHKNLNLEVDFMKGLIPSSENIAMAVFNLLDPELRKQGVALHCVKLYETENNYVEYFGEED